MHSVPSSALAAVFRAENQPMALERFALPELKRGEALVQISCATICGSDLHSFYGRRPAPTPGVLGHEMVGHLAAMGPGGARDFRGNPLTVGDRVTWSMVWSCGECYYCQRGLPSKCEHLMKFGHEAVKAGCEFSGGFAEFCHLPERTAIFKIPDDLPDVVAAPANCATATVAAMFRHAGSVAGQSVVVFGAGMLGLTACAMAAVGGAKPIIAVEPGSERRA